MFFQRNRFGWRRASDLKLKMEKEIESFKKSLNIALDQYFHYNTALGFMESKHNIDDFTDIVYGEVVRGQIVSFYSPDNTDKKVRVSTNLKTLPDGSISGGCRIEFANTEYDVDPKYNPYTISASDASSIYESIKRDPYSENTSKLLHSYFKKNTSIIEEFEPNKIGYLNPNPWNDMLNSDGTPVNSMSDWMVKPKAPKVTTPKQIVLTPEQALVLEFFGLTKIPDNQVINLKDKDILEKAFEFPALLEIQKAIFNNVIRIYFWEEKVVTGKDRGAKYFDQFFKKGTLYFTKPGINSPFELKVNLTFAVRAGLELNLTYESSVGGGNINLSYKKSNFTLPLNMNQVFPSIHQNQEFKTFLQNVLKSLGLYEEPNEELSLAKNNAIAITKAFVYAYLDKKIEISDSEILYKKDSEYRIEPISIQEFVSFTYDLKTKASRVNIYYGKFDEKKNIETLDFKPVITLEIALDPFSTRVQNFLKRSIMKLDVPVQTPPSDIIGDLPTQPKEEAIKAFSLYSKYQNLDNFIARIKPIINLLPLDSYEYTEEKAITTLKSRLDGFKTMEKYRVVTMANVMSALNYVKPLLDSIKKTPILVPEEPEVVEQPIITPTIEQPVFTPPVIEEPVFTPPSRVKSPRVRQPKPIITPVIEQPIFTPPVIEEPIFTPPPMVKQPRVRRPNVPSPSIIEKSDFLPEIEETPILKQRTRKDLPINQPISLPPKPPRVRQPKPLITPTIEQPIFTPPVIEEPIFTPPSMVKQPRVRQPKPVIEEQVFNPPVIKTPEPVYTAIQQKAADAFSFLAAELNLGSLHPNDIYLVMSEIKPITDKLPGRAPSVTKTITPLIVKKVIQVFADLHNYYDFSDLSPKSVNEVLMALKPLMDKLPALMLKPVAPKKVKTDILAEKAIHTFEYLNADLELGSLKPTEIYELTSQIKPLTDKMIGTPLKPLASLTPSLVNKIIMALKNLDKIYDLGDLTITEANEVLGILKPLMDKVPNLSFKKKAFWF